jgi:tetratricopeptide (TPR) repeat protein
LEKKPITGMILLKTQDLWRGLMLAAQLAFMAAILATLSPMTAFAEADETISKHVAAAEDALKSNDFWHASSEYRKAAELSDDADIAKQATRIAYTYGFNDDALASAKRWVALSESNDEALLYLALLELRAGDIKQSRNEFRKLLARGDEAADERLINLIPFLSDENSADADALMRQLSKPYKKSPYAHYAAAVLALYAGDSEEAQKRAKKSAELKPEWLKPHLLYARALLMAGDEEGAIDYTARLVGDNPDPDPEARLELAIMYLAAGRDDDALSQINQVLLEQPARTDALRLLAIINFRLENLDAARQDFEDLLSTGQYTMDAFYYLARIADHRGESKRAIALYSKVTQGDNTVFSQRRVSAILATESEFELAQKHLESFGRTHPNYAVDMIQAQAQLLASQDRFEEALEYFDRVIKYRPDSESAFLGKAELLLAMDQVDDAVAAYREAVQRWPDSAISLNALGYTLTDRTTEHGEAAKLIRKAMKLDPDSAAIIDSHGWVLYRLGEYEEALAELERAYEKLEDPEVAAHIIEVLWKLDRQDEALQRLVDAEELWPESSLLENVRGLVAPEG